MTVHDKRAIDNGTAASAYSPAVISNGLCWVSGQGGLDPDTRRPVAGGIEAETTQALANLAAILGEEGMSLDDVVTVTCYLIDNDEWGAMSEAYAKAFAGVAVLPSRTAVAVSGLPFGIRVEITAVARVPE